MDEENNGPGPELKKMVGENTAGIRTNKKGKKYAIIQEDVYRGPNAGDSIMIGNSTLIKNRISGGNATDLKHGISGYLEGGDYGIQKTGPKKYELKGDFEPKGKLGSNRRKAEYDARNWKYDKTIK